MFKKIYKKLRKNFQKKKQPKTIFLSQKKIYNHHLIKRSTFDKKLSLKIITSHDSNYNNVGKITVETMKNYAKKYNLEFEFLPMPSTGRAQTWNKIISIKEQILRKKNDYIMWVDADAFFHKDAENILSVIEDKYEIYLSSHYCGVFKGSNYKNTVLTVNRINCGVMIFKVTNFCIKFLEKVWNKKNYIDHYWYEQAAIMDLVGLKVDITGNLKDNAGDDFYLKKIKFLNKEWNSIPSSSEISTESFRPSIIHLAGIKNEIRMRFLKNYLNKM